MLIESFPELRPLRPAVRVRVRSDRCRLLYQRKPKMNGTYSVGVFESMWW